MTDKPFLLLRGLARENRYWSDFPQHLAESFPKCRILTPDIPGNGVYWQQTSPSRIQDMTDFLRGILSLTEPVNVIGLSMGGMIALDWMSRYPDDIASGVLINASARPGSPFYRRLRWQNYPVLFRLGRLDINRREQLYLTLTSNLRAQDTRLLEQWQTWQRQYPVSQTNTLRQLLAAAKFTLPQKLTQPLLLFASQADRLVDWRCSASLANALRTELIVHPTAGHDLSLDDPGWLCRHIAHWKARPRVCRDDGFESLSTTNANLA